MIFRMLLSNLVVLVLGGLFLILLIEEQNARGRPVMCSD